MTEPGLVARPVISACAGLHRYDTGRLVRHELRELWSRQLLAEYDGTVCQRAMNLEHVFCQIDADDANVFHGCPVFHLCFQNRKCGTLYAVWGERHPPHLSALGWRLIGGPFGDGWRIDQTSFAALSVSLLLAATV